MNTETQTKTQQKTTGSQMSRVGARPHACAESGRQTVRRKTSSVYTASSHKTMKMRRWLLLSWTRTELSVCLLSLHTHFPAILHSRPGVRTCSYSKTIRAQLLRMHAGAVCVWRDRPCAGKFERELRQHAKAHEHVTVRVMMCAKPYTRCSCHCHHPSHVRSQHQNGYMCWSGSGMLRREHTVSRTP